MKTVTNKEIAIKLDHLIEIVSEHRLEFKEHLKQDAAVAAEVLKLTTVEEGRRWQIRTLWGATSVALLGALARVIWS